MKPLTELLEQLKGVRPRCGKKLSFDPTKVDVRVLQDEKKDRQ